MGCERFKTICEYWGSFAGRHPHLAAYGEKLADYAHHGIMRDSESVEFNVHFTGRMPRLTFWLTTTGLALMALTALVAVRITLWAVAQVLNLVSLLAGQTHLKIGFILREETRGSLMSQIVAKQYIIEYIRIPRCPQSQPLEWHF